jgi:hypothetical protein
MRQREVAEVLRRVIDGSPLRRISIDLGLDYGTGGAPIHDGGRARGAQASRPAEPRQGGFRSRGAGAGKGQPWVEARTLPGRDYLGPASSQPRPEFLASFWLADVLAGCTRMSKGTAKQARGGRK